MAHIELFNISIQGLLFIPVISLVLILIYFRNKLYILDGYFTAIDSKFSTNFQKALLYFLFTSFAIFIGFLICTITFPYSDIDNAMQGAIQAFFINGINPYANNVVPHIFINSQTTNIIYGTYNYGPIDLLCYGIGFFIFYPFFGPGWWLYVSNIVLILLIYVIIRKIIQIPETIKFIPFILLSSLFMQDNTVLMVFFLAIAWAIHEKINNKSKYPLVTIFLTIGVFSKLFLLFTLFGYFAIVFRSNIKLWVQNGLISLGVAILIIFPFGYKDVINSIFIFHVDLSLRKSFAIIQGGIPLYLDIFHLDWLFIPLAFTLTGVFIVISDKYVPDQLKLKISIFSILNLVLLPSSEYAFFFIPGLLLLLQYYENHLDKYNKSVYVGQNQFIKTIP